MFRQRLEHKTKPHGGALELREIRGRNEPNVDGRLCHGLLVLSFFVGVLAAVVAHFKCPTSPPVDERCSDISTIDQRLRGFRVADDHSY